MVSKCKTLNKHFLENAKLESTKKNKGFTLIELLAIIVILAVIALIATPIITNIINGARKEAAKDSAYGYIEALEYNNGISEIESNSGLEDGTYKVRDIKSRVNIRGNKPTYGTVTIKDKKVSNANLCIGGYIVSYDGLNAKALSGCIEKEDETGPDIVIGTISGTTNSLTIPFTAIDEETGIESVSCFYSTDKSYNLKGKIENNECKLSNLKNDTLYNFKIEATNNGGIKGEITGSHKTGNFESIEVLVSPSDWSSSKKISIKGSTAGSTLEYKVVSGTKVKTDWTKYTSDITVDWAANTTTPTYIYARLNDNVNVSETASLTITKIDTTEPVLNLSNASVTTNSITVPISTSDSESGIKSTTCSYGVSTSYGSKGVIGSNNCSMSGLKNNTTYYYQVTTTNNAGLTTTKTGNIKTGEFASVEIEATPSDWSSSKKISIKGSTAGSTLEYRVVSGTTVKQNWTKYTSDITVNWAANITTPTYIYARLNDGVNVSETASLTITKVDTTAPSCNIKLKSNTTSSVLISAECEDNESGVKEYYFRIGNEKYTKVDSNEYEFKSLRLSEIKVKVVDFCGNYKENQMTEEDREKAYDVIYNDIKNKVDNIKTNIFLINHPIGSIYETVNSDENTAAKMASKYGGTWEAFGTNRVLRGSSQSASTTGGSDSVKLSASQIPSITASGNTNNTGSGYSYSWNTTGTNNATTANGGSHSHSYVVETAGSNYNMQTTYAGFRDRVYVRAYLSEGNTTSTAGNHSHNYSNTYVTSVSGFASHGHSITNVRANNSQTNVSVVDPYITIYRYKRVS